MGNIDRNYTLLRGRIAQLADLSNVSPMLASKGPSSKPIRSLLNPDHSDVGNKEEEEEEEEEEYRSQREGKSPSQLLMVKQSSITLPAISVQPYARSFFISNPLGSHTYTNTNGKHVSQKYRMVPIQQKFSFGSININDKSNWGFNVAVDAIIRSHCDQGQVKGEKDEKEHPQKVKIDSSYNDRGKMTCLPLLCAEFKASSKPKDIFIQEDAELAAIIYEKWYGMGRDEDEDEADSS
ncbi:hypothetical protein ACHAPG_011571 [Botrytis cinerea]